uniref:Uncharacterized protein n=1 Tax=Moniliophthora roreri TaxID=221103 RepID=A0A0W0FJ41_MONRR
MALWANVHSSSPRFCTLLPQSEDLEKHSTLHLAPDSVPGLDG